MFAASSKRAFSSTSAVTDLPASAASHSAATIGLSQRGAVERLLDRQHVRVARRLLQEADHHVEGLVGVMQQHVLLPDRGEHVAVVVLHPFGHARGEGRPQQVRAAATGSAPSGRPRPAGPCTSTTSSSVTASSSMISARRSSGAPAVIFRRITSPRRRRFSAVSNSRTRSSASSSTSRSLSRSTRKVQWPWSV